MNALDQPQEVFAGLLEFFQSLSQVQHLWQVPVLVVALLLGAGASIALGRRLQQEHVTQGRQSRELRGILFAAASAVTLLLFFRAFAHGRPAPLLRMAIAVMLALAAARLGVYLLRYVLALSQRSLALQSFFVKTVWLLFALHVTGLLTPMLELLQDVSFFLGGAQVSLLQVLQAVLVVSVLLMFSLWLGRTLEVKLMRAEAIDTHFRVILVKVLRGLLVFLAVVIALPLVGIESTFLSLLGGALGVGLGLALQRVTSNYVSGFIILMDRSIRLGDVITVDGKQGTVMRLDARCIALSATDGTVFLVPNETFLTQTIVNHSLSSQGVCRNLMLEVSYGSDLDQVSAILLQAAQNQNRIQSDPAASVTIMRWTGHGVELALQYWIVDPGVSEVGLRSQLLRHIQQGFKEAGITVPLRDGASASVV